MTPLYAFEDRCREFVNDSAVPMKTAARLTELMCWPRENMSPAIGTLWAPLQPLHQALFVEGVLAHWE